MRKKTKSMSKNNEIFHVSLITNILEFNESHLKAIILIDTEFDK